MTTILALDLGTYAGFALGSDDGTSDATGVCGLMLRGAWTFEFTAAEKKADPHPPGRRHFDGGGPRYTKFAEKLDRLMAAAPFDRVVFEEVRRHKGAIAAQIHGGLLATMQAWCERQEPKVPYSGVGVGAIKKFATGKGNATKGEMMSAVEKLGYSCETDDEADAVAMLLMVLEAVSLSSTKEG